MTQEKVSAILEQHVPEKAFTYCLQLWSEEPFILKLTKSRQTKIGDFTSRKDATHPRVTLNRDLNAYTFLLTYIHEVAHLHVFLAFGHRVAPHGEHWKLTFQKLLEPVLTREVFPQEIFNALTKHMLNPKASSYADTELTQALRNFDIDNHNHIVLADLPEGSMFQLSGKHFIKGKLRRTRILCKETKSKRQYLVPADVLVNNVQLSLL